MVIKLKTPYSLNFIIRKAIPQDAEAIASCLLLAMDTIVYEFIGRNDAKEALKFMSHFIGQTQNQYAFSNCWVAQENERIIAAINIYNGAELKTLRQPILDYISETYNRELYLEDETQEGEFYIDTLGVTLDQQGKGTGSKLLKFIIDKIVIEEQKTLGLLVDHDNPKAKSLYLKLGFKSVGEKKLVGKSLTHMQITPDLAISK